MDIFNQKTLSGIYPNVKKIVITYNVSSGGMGVVSTDNNRIVINPKGRITENIPCPNRTCGRAIPLTERIDYCVKNGLERYEFVEMCSGREHREHDHAGSCLTTFTVCMEFSYR